MQISQFLVWSWNWFSSPAWYVIFVHSQDNSSFFFYWQIIFLIPWECGPYAKEVGRLTPSSFSKSTLLVLFPALYLLYITLFSPSCLVIYINLPLQTFIPQTPPIVLVPSFSRHSLGSSQVSQVRQAGRLTMDHPSSFCFSKSNSPLSTPLYSR